MILKTSQRGGGQDLATHLLNTHANERVEILDMRGTVARDLHGAFAEWQALSSATNCKKYIYSMSINPDPQQRPLTREELDDYIARVEKRLGLEGQSRALVAHTKDGRAHYHSVWSRIDTEKFKAVHLFRDQIILQDITRQFAREKGLRLPERMRDEKKKDRSKDRTRRKNFAEQQQEERTGVTKEERRREITQCWKQSDSAAGFIAALESKGYYLAQGDKRAYVILDRYGEIHSLSRHVEGVKTADLKQRLPAPDQLRTIAQAKKLSMRTHAPRVREEFQRAADHRRATLDREQKQRRDAIMKKIDALAKRHERELQALIARYESGGSPPPPVKGLAAFLGKITGITKIREARKRRKDAARMTHYERAVAAAKKQQAREMNDFVRQLRALGRVEKREIKSLATELRREERARERSLEISQRRQEKKRDFREAAFEILKAQDKDRSPERTEARGEEDSKVPVFHKDQKPISKKVAEKFKAMARDADERERKRRGRDRDRPR